MKKRVLIIGAGTSGLMAANQLASSDIDLTIIDRMRSPGRKFLVAGKGGFNLTNSLQSEAFIDQYADALICNAVRTYSNADFIEWLSEIGVPTYTGSSGRIFPRKDIKPAMVLRCWLAPLIDNPNVQFLMETRLVKILDRSVVVQSKQDIPVTLPFDGLILALGGASWSKTGSDGAWTELWKDFGRPIVQFESSNARINVLPSSGFSGLAGNYIKNCKVISDDFEQMGDITIQEEGLEGTPIYACNKAVRAGKNIYLDFKPSFELEKIKYILSKSKNHSTALRELKLSETVQHILKSKLTKSEFVDHSILANAIKLFPVEYAGLAPTEEAISVVGGIPLPELDDDFCLKNAKAIYCVGEMLDWDAPTGGFLIQGCVSSAVVAARALQKELKLI